MHSLVSIRVGDVPMGVLLFGQLTGQRQDTASAGSGAGAGSGSGSGSGELAEPQGAAIMSLFLPTDATDEVGVQLRTLGL